MHYEHNKKTKALSFNKRLIFVILGLILFVVFLGLIIWSSIVLNDIPATYAKDSEDYKNALTFGILNGFSDFIALILLINICSFSYSMKLFRLKTKSEKLIDENKKIIPNNTSNSPTNLNGDSINESFQNKNNNEGLECC